jgi:lipoprotein-releasing system permease protein
VTEPFEADVLAAEITENLDDDSLEVSNWKDENQQLLSGLSGQTTSSLMIQIFVIISVVLGISSVLAITVIQKSRQIGILKAMGLKDGSASQIFLFQGVVLGFFGGLVGIVLGVGLLWAFSTFALNPDGTAVVPIYLDPVFIGLSGLIAVLASTIASLIPAIRSRKLSPIEVIRNG